jgi:hypothetical protein
VRACQRSSRDDDDDDGGGGGGDYENDGDDLAENTNLHSLDGSLLSVGGSPAKRNAWGYVKHLITNRQR